MTREQCEHPQPSREALEKILRKQFPFMTGIPGFPIKVVVEEIMAWATGQMRDMPDALRTMYCAPNPRESQHCFHQEWTHGGTQDRCCWCNTVWKQPLVPAHGAFGLKK